MEAEALLRQLEGVRETGQGKWQAKCPSHDDTTASLSIGLGDDGGRLLCFCHAGCETEDIVGALGLTLADLMPENDHARSNGNGHAGGNGKAQFEELKGYDYVDEEGNRLFQCVRKPGKKFSQRQPKDGGGWVWNLKGVRRVLYHLDRLENADLDTVYVCEGEKDADALWNIGLAATTCPMGAGKWRPEYADMLKGFHVCVLPDNDKPGKAHAEQVAKSCHGSAESVKVLELSGLEEKGDVSDWLQAGGTADELRKLTDGAPEWVATAEPELKAKAKPKPKPAAKGEKIAGSKLDPGPEAAAMLADESRDGVSRLRYWRGGFHRWTAGAYRQAPDDEVRASIMLRLNPRARAVTKSVVTNVLEQLKAQSAIPSRTEPPVWLTGEKPWPANELLPARNGVFHLPSLVEGREPFRIAPTPRLFTTSALDYDVTPDAPRPEAWLRFMAQIWPGDQESIDCLQDWFGYSLTPDTSQQKILFLVGPKRSGKGTVARIVGGLIGRENIASPTLSSFGTNFGLWPLLGKSVAIIPDARLSGRSDRAAVTERLLSISGEDSLTVDRKYAQPVTAKLSTRLVMLSNEIPRLTDASGALASRMIILRMTESWYGREDPGLTDRLLTELPGILLWALAGWMRLRDRGHFLQPESSGQLVREMEAMGSPARVFVEECCQLDSDAVVPRLEIYEAYCEWAKAEATSRTRPASEGTCERPFRRSVTVNQGWAGNELGVIRGLGYGLTPKWNRWHRRGTGNGTGKIVLKPERKGTGTGGTRNYKPYAIHTGAYARAYVHGPQYVGTCSTCSALPKRG